MFLYGNLCASGWWRTRPPIGECQPQEGVRGTLLADESSPGFEHAPQAEKLVSHDARSRNRVCLFGNSRELERLVF